MIQSSEITERNQEWDTSGKNIEDIMEVLQAADQARTSQTFYWLQPAQDHLHPGSWLGTYLLCQESRRNHS